MNDDDSTLPERASCARVRGRLIELLDHDLDPLAAARDAGHLEACAPCAAEREELGRVLALARTLAEPTARELAFARAGLAERLAGVRPRRVRPLVRRLAQASAAAAAAAVALAALELGARRARGWIPPSRALADPRALELPHPAHWVDGLRNLWHREG